MHRIELNTAKPARKKYVFNENSFKELFPRNIITYLPVKTETYLKQHIFPDPSYFIYTGFNVLCLTCENGTCL